MLKIYACLAGDWVCLTDDPDCTIGENKKSPSVWWEENASIYSQNPNGIICRKYRTQMLSVLLLAGFIFSAA